MTGDADALARLLRLLESTQWQSPAEIAALQREQLFNLATHCQKASQFFRARLEAVGFSVRELAEPGGLQKLPVLHRRDVQTAAGFYCENVPQQHGSTFETRTSGSTGEPVVIRRTQANELDWLATTMREHLWHRRDFMQRICAIRANITQRIALSDWGPPVNLLFKSAPLLGLPITLDVGEHAREIAGFEPHTLLIYPSTLAGLLNWCAAHGATLASVKNILTMGETLSPETRARAAAYFGAEIADLYSSQELGTIAIQCPDSGLYHVMEENLIVEVLDDRGGQVGTGETGRLTITDLRNYATPLVRYDIGDYAETGPPCPCGRGLATLKSILGRERNLILMPDGTRHWPLVGFHKFREIAPVAQYQFIQETRTSIELRLVAERALTGEEEDRLRRLIQKVLGYDFAIRLVYFDKKIPAGANGKFEEFVCRAA